jgi:hypothetical protein
MRIAPIDRRSWTASNPIGPRQHADVGAIRRWAVDGIAVPRGSSIALSAKVMLRQDVQVVSGPGRTSHCAWVGPNPEPPLLAKGLPPAKPLCRGDRRIERYAFLRSPLAPRHESCPGTSDFEDGVTIPASSTVQF